DPAFVARARYGSCGESSSACALWTALDAGFLPSASLLFGFVHGAVRTRDEIVWRHLVVRPCKPERCVQLDPVRSDDNGSAEGRVHAGDDLDCVFEARDARTDDEELVSAQTTNLVAAAKRGPHATGCCDENRVARGVAILVVDVLEIVEVDEDDRDPV